ncbi:hypothetical protein GCM10018966_010370 [Streptomyces yanii]
MAHVDTGMDLTSQERALTQHIASLDNTIYRGLGKSREGEATWGDQMALNMGKLLYGVGHERDITRGCAAALPGRTRLRATGGPSAARADAARARR